VGKVKREMEQRYLTLSQAAIYTGFSPRTLYKWATDEKIPVQKIGRLWRFDKEELDEFMHKGYTPTQVL